MEDIRMLKRFFADFSKYFKYAKYAAKSALNAEVAGSYLNWLWWIFNPFCMMLIYTFMFGYVFGAKEQFFPIYIFLGLTLWDYFNRTITASVKMIKKNKPIVTKVYIPKFVLLETEMMVNFIKMLISFGVIVVMMIIFRVPVSWRILWLIPILFVLTIFTFGLSSIVMHFGVYVEDLTNIIKIVLRFVFYLTGVFWSINKRIPAPYNHYVLRCNPMAYLINEARNALIYNTSPNLKFLGIWFVISLLLCIFGLHKIYKYENSYAKVI